MRAGLRRVLEAPGLRWKIAVAVAILSMPALWTGLGGDELLHLALMHGRLGPEVGPFGLFSFLPDEPEVRHRMLDAGVLPWWSSPEIQIAFWRPITSLTHWVDYTLWPNAPALMAAQNVAWYTVAVLLATALFRRVQGVGWVAGLAALLFAVDDAHAVTLGWIAARNALIGAAAGIGALVAHDRWRRDAWQPGAVLGPGLFAVSLLAAESAIAYAGYLAAHALWLDPAQRWRRLGALVPYAAVVIAWRVAWTLAGGGIAGSVLYVDPTSDPVGFAGRAAAFLPIYTFSQLYALPPEMLALVAGASPAISIGMVALLAALLWGLAPLRALPSARFWATGLVLAAVPMCAALPQERLLLPLGLGGMGLVSLAVESAKGSRRYLAGALLVLHGLLAPALFPLRTAFFPFIHERMEMAARLPGDSDVAGRTAVLIGAPVDVFAMLIPVFRTMGRTIQEGQSPARSWTLYVGREPIEVSRPEADTLVLRTRRGWGATPIDQMTREAPFHVGETRALDGMTAEVMETNPQGRALVVRFRFDPPPDDPAWVFYAWDLPSPVPFELPEPGGSIRLDAPELF